MDSFFLYRQPANAGRAKHGTKRPSDVHINLQFRTWQDSASPVHTSDLHNLCWLYHSQKLALHRYVGKGRGREMRL